MELAGKEIIVVGLGRSGVAAANLCLDHGATVIGTDALARELTTEPMRALEARGATLMLGGHRDVPWATADLVVISPGVPPFDALDQATAAGIEVIGELELACRFVRAPIGVVGGTNGKSTVTTWVGAMLQAPGRSVFLGGNLGTPLSEHLDERFDVVVLEISSFQAERVPLLHPKAAALLNISDDHLDRYADFDAYARAKGNVFVNMESDDVAVIPVGDATCAREAGRGRARVVTFGPGGDVRPESGKLVDGVRGWTFPLDEIRLKGGHNVLNACAAVATAAGLGATEQQIRSALGTFEGLTHRTTLVLELEGVRFYDDSKATNVGAAVAALRGLAEPKAVLIAGGRDKLGSYGPLVETLRERGRALVLIGEAAERIAAQAADVIPTLRAGSMQEAVELAYENARPGDAVLLSPACASYDMFDHYAHRGDVFCEAARALVASRTQRQEGA